MTTNDLIPTRCPRCHSGHRSQAEKTKALTTGQPVRCNHCGLVIRMSPIFILIGRESYTGAQDLE